MIQSILNLNMFNGVFSKVAVSWDMCKALFQCWLELFKITLWRVFGKSREIRKSLLEGSGGVPEAAKRLQKALREGKKRPRASKSHLGAILEPKHERQPIPIPPIWGPWGGLWGALGRLGGAFLGDLVAHRFCIVFLLIFRRFWDSFWYQKSKKNDDKTKLF